MSSFDRAVKLLNGSVAEENGQAMVEYSLLVAFIALVALAGAQVLGVDVLGLFQSGAGGFH